MAKPAAIDVDYEVVIVPFEHTIGLPPIIYRDPLPLMEVVLEECH